MFKHNLKVAFRNLWKYKNQTLISVIGLATGFACFAIAALWIRYEMTYDRFHKNADRIYCVYRPSETASSGVSRHHNPHHVAKYLKKTFPEIVRAVSIAPPHKDHNIEFDGIEYPVDIIGADSSFFSMFDVKLVEGSMDFVIPDNKKLAITRKKALQLFGTESPIGKTVKMDKSELTICAVVTEFPRQTCYSFDFIRAIYDASYTSIPSSLAEHEWHYRTGNTLIELHPGVDIAAFRRKLYGHKIEGHNSITKMSILPLTSVRYKDPDIERDVKFQHITIFSVAGLLLILCTLFNYLTLFISRFRVRQRELALRAVYGATNRSLLALLSVEFVMSLSAALLFGLYLIYLILPKFVKLSGIQLEQTSIYFESLTYIAVIAVISLLTFAVTITVFRRRSLNASIRNANRRLFRKVSITVQLIVSTGFMFCTIVILKQMYHLHNTDLGFACKNRGSAYVFTRNMENVDVLEDKLRQIPDITETVKNVYPVLPNMNSIFISMEKWDGKPVDAENINIEMKCISEQYQKYYELQLIEGEFLSSSDGPHHVLINESAMKLFNWNTATGKLFGHAYRVKGVVKNIYSAAPTVPAHPAFYTLNGLHINNMLFGAATEPSILFKFREGTWKSCRAKIEEAVKAVYPGLNSKIISTEEEYDKYLKSENALLHILTVISLVCMTVCVFGFVSMVSLSCEERRKEIAIRKINGATVKDILDIFFMEHATTLMLGTLIAFPIGYIIMKRWLENYILQTEMSAWIYLSILLALIVVIVLCIGGRVYKTSRENPVNAIK
jgi:ABC-type antimicrobial peptide transport system permease subunit